MNPTHTNVLAQRAGILLFVAACALALSTVLRGATPPAGDWISTAALTVRQTYDDNVFLQETGPLADRGSWMSSVQAQLGARFERSPALKAIVSYAPEVVYFHDEPGEDHVTHRAALNFSGEHRKAPWETNHAITWIDGASENLVFTGVGGAPAAGGVPMRERRDALVYRGSGKATLARGAWFLRPGVACYVHDFRSRQSTAPGYQNYADRSDVSGGAELGFKLNDHTSLFAGYRYGRQEQDQLFATGPAYDSAYQRVLVGVESNVRPGLKVSAVAGPDFRDFGPLVAVGAADKPTLAFVDVAVTVTPRKGEQVTFAVKQFTQPGFGGRSVYEDSTCEAKWRRVVNDRWTLAAELRAYNTDFLAPVLRDDWIFTASVEATWTFQQNWSLTGSFVRDVAESRIPNTPAREFHHAVVSLGLRHKFR